MSPALRREEVVVDLVETAAVDMEEEETDTAEEVAEEAVAMEEGVGVIVDTAEAAVVVAAIEVVVDMTMAAATTITTGMEVTDTTMGEVEAEDVDMEVGVVVVMGAVVDMITEVVTATEMVVTKEFCISQQHSHTVTSRAGGHASDPPCPSLCGEFSCTIFRVFSICLKFYVAFLNPF